VPGDIEVDGKNPSGQKRQGGNQNRKEYVP